MEKIAIIDLGSNSARMVLVNILDGGYFVVFDELKETVRLAQDGMGRLFETATHCADHKNP